MNLTLYGIETMKDESGELSFTSTRTENGELLVVPKPVRNASLRRFSPPSRMEQGWALHQPQDH
jgi:hypothetical protein